MNKFKKLFSILSTSLILGILLNGCSNQNLNKTSDTPSTAKEPLRMAVAPYQDIALIVNAKETNLEKKYNLNLDFVTVSGEEMLSCLASAGQTVDVSYALLTEYLMKSENINREGADKIIFLYPIFVFRGGGFITFNPEVPELNSKNINDVVLIKKFLSFKIGTPKSTWSEMMLFMLAKKAGMKLSDLHYMDIPLGDGLLAAQNGSLDMSAAGLTQRNECLKRGGRLVLSTNTLGMGDIIGLACRESTYKRRKKEIQSFIRLWVECANYCLDDVDHRCNAELAYLKANSSTKYTLDEFKKALALEYFPKDIAEIQKEMVSDKGQYSIKKSTNMINQYLIAIGAIKRAMPAPIPVALDKVPVNNK